jgi:hypothetical protein
MAGTAVVAVKSDGRRPAAPGVDLVGPLALARGLSRSGRQASAEFSPAPVDPGGPDGAEGPEPAPRPARAFPDPLASWC